MAVLIRYTSVVSKDKPEWKVQYSLSQIIRHHSFKKKVDDNKQDRGWHVATCWDATKDDLTTAICAMTNQCGLMQLWTRGIAHPNRLAMQLQCKSWWRHQMETFSVLLALCVGIHRSPVNSPHKGQWRGALMFSLICNRCLNKQPCGWWFATPSGSLWRHCNVWNATQSPAYIARAMNNFPRRVGMWII